MLSRRKRPNRQQWSILRNRLTIKRTHLILIKIPILCKNKILFLKYEQMWALSFENVVNPLIEMTMVNFVNYKRLHDLCVHFVCILDQVFLIRRILTNQIIIGGINKLAKNFRHLTLFFEINPEFMIHIILKKEFSFFN